MNDTVRETANRGSSSDTTIYSLLHAAHALEARLESVLGHVGLSSPKFSVLSALVDAGEPLSLSELAAKLSCVRSNMTQLVDRLEADDLVQRQHCPSDRRSVKAVITESGKQRQLAGAEAVAKLHTEFSSLVSEADRAALERMLAALA